MDEIWKPIPRYEGWYSASNLGNVRRDKASPGTRVHILKNTLTGLYYMIWLYKNAQKKHILVHHIIAETFLGERPKGLVINHIDGNKLNNSIDNLEYVTYSQNMKHAIRTGLWKHLGEDNRLSKITNKNAISIREEYSKGNISQRKLAKIYGIKQASLWAIVHYKTYKNIASIDTLKLAGIE